MLRKWLGINVLENRYDSLWDEVRELKTRVFELEVETSLRSRPGGRYQVISAPKFSTSQKLDRLYDYLGLYISTTPEKSKIVSKVGNNG